jgi:hypothetical protein
MNEVRFLAISCVSFFAALASACRTSGEPQTSHAIVYGKVTTMSGTPVGDAAVGADVCLSDKVYSFPARTTQNGDYRFVFTTIGHGPTCVMVSAIRGSSGTRDTVTTIASSLVELREGESGYDSIRVDVRLP